MNKTLGPAFIFILFVSLPHLCAQTNEGREFWFSFMEHRDIGTNTMVAMITSKHNTSGTISIPGRNWSQSFGVSANQVTVINLPAYAETRGSETIANNGIKVTSNLPVSVYIHQYHSARSEASVVLPKESLGKEYYIISYFGVNRQGVALRLRAVRARKSDHV